MDLVGGVGEDAGRGHADGLTDQFGIEVGDQIDQTGQREGGETLFLTERILATGTGLTRVMRVRVICVTITCGLCGAALLTVIETALQRCPGGRVERDGMAPTAQPDGALLHVDVGHLEVA